MTSLLKRGKGSTPPKKVVDQPPKKVERFDQPPKKVEKLDHPPKKMERFDLPSKKVEWLE